MKHVRSCSEKPWLHGAYVHPSNLCRVATWQAHTFHWRLSRLGRARLLLPVFSSFYSGVAAHCLLQHKGSLWIFDLRGTALSAWTCSQAHPYMCREAGVAEECWCGRTAHALKRVHDHNSLWQKPGFPSLLCLQQRLLGTIQGKHMLCSVLIF